LDVKNPPLNGKKRRRPRATALEGTPADRQRLRDDLGQRLRAAREQKNIGLRELARQLGVSPSLISQIETGKTEPSINTLFAMVSELELSVNEIVFDPTRETARPSTRVTPRARSASARRVVGPAAADPPGSPVQRSTNRTAISLESGVGWDRLTARPDHNVDFLLLRYPPGSESTPPHSLMRHNGTEYAYLISGELKLTLGFDQHVLTPGDSICFESTTPHGYRNDSEIPAVGVWFVVEPG